MSAPSQPTMLGVALRAARGCRSWIEFAADGPIHWDRLRAMADTPLRRVPPVSMIRKLTEVLQVEWQDVAALLAADLGKDIPPAGLVKMTVREHATGTGRDAETAARWLGVSMETVARIAAAAAVA